METITRGFTNLKKYKDGNKMIIYKTYNGFNHAVKYEDLSSFSFVPKLLENSEEKIVSTFIEGEELSTPSTEDLKKLGQIMREIHTSDLKLPKNNLKQRAHAYLKTIHEKGIHIDVLEDNYKSMIKLIYKMQKVNPLHNDIWMSNIIKDEDSKIWLIDWEYATMGDKHFDLAYYIEAQKLDEGQQKMLLDAYDAVDGKPSHNKELLEKYKRFVIWLTICWAHAQDELPFPTQDLISKLGAK